jgi:hypothetical protein
VALVWERATRHHPRMRRPLAHGVLVLALIGPRAASAQAEPTASALKMAQDLVEEGRALGRQGQWAEALERFQRARSVSAKTTPQLAFYVGHAEARVGKLVEAAVDLRRAIELAHSAGNDQVAVAAQGELPELEARTPLLRIAASGAVGLQIDGSTLGVAALGDAVPLDPGEHVVVVRFPTGAVTRHVAMVERQRMTLSIEPPAGAAAANPAAQDEGSGTSLASAGATSPPTLAPPVSEDGGAGRRVVGLAVAGVGAASLVAGGVFYLLARSALSPVTSACPSSPCAAPSGSPLQSDYQDAQSKQTIAIVLASAGAALAATGLVLFATGGSSGRPSSSASVVRVAPWLGPGNGGAVLNGQF